jgi:hypothetical protein
VCLVDTLSDIQSLANGRSDWSPLGQLRSLILQKICPRMRWKRMRRHIIETRVFLSKTISSFAICKRLLSRHRSKSCGCSQPNKTSRMIGTVGWDLYRSLPLQDRTSLSSTDFGARAARFPAESSRRTSLFLTICLILSFLLVVSKTSSTASKKSQDQRLSSWLIPKNAREPRSCFAGQKHLEATIDPESNPAATEIRRHEPHDLVNTLTSPELKTCSR